MAYTFVHKIINGSLESYGVIDQKEMKAYLADGWVRDPKDLSNASAETKTKKTKAKESDPTREELETKAKELNIVFSKRTADKTLLKKINEALGE